MTAKRPYLLRAFYEWMADNDLTPHIVVDATMPGVRVPLEFVQDGQIVLNIAARAVGNLELGNDAILFHARFGGRPHSVNVPMYAVQAIYARENGSGTMFEPEESYEAIEQTAQEEAQQTPFMTVATGSADEAPVESKESQMDETEDTPTPPERPKGRPSLSIVK